jgi:hypothetical protein
VDTVLSRVPLRTAVRGVAAFVAVRADHRRGLGVDQLLWHRRQHHSHHWPSSALRSVSDRSNRADCDKAIACTSLREFSWSITHKASRDGPPHSRTDTVRNRKNRFSTALGT